MAKKLDKKGLNEKIIRSLDEAFELASRVFSMDADYVWKINDRFKAALEEMGQSSSTASSGFTNIITSLAIKCANQEIDIRYHQVQIQDPPMFSFRPISEKVVYPWLSRHSFEGAKSGWQTRTFERPKPYLMDYDENIGEIKEAFLTCYDEVEESDSSPILGLAYLLLKQVELRERKKLELTIPGNNEIEFILNLLSSHFFSSYRGKGASRLPVLALYAIYSLMIKELQRYSGKKLLPLQRHSAADARTGSPGDIEIANKDGSLFEGLEIKHSIKFSNELIEDIIKKIGPFGLDRFYALTTHQDCQPDDEVKETIRKAHSALGCQIIVNGVMPTIRYYLRLLSTPSEIFKHYVELLKKDEAISFEHRETWNNIVHSF